MDEEAYKKSLAEAGVDVPDLNVEQAPEAPTAETPEAPTEPTVPLTTEEPKEQRKRSIYDEYKDKKSELKTERDLRADIERERDDLKAKLDAVATATTPEERADAQDELDSFATEIGADPTAIKRMRDLFLKDLKPQVDPELAKDLQEFKAWKSQNSQVVEKQLFEQEFAKVTPTIKDMFPKVSAEEIDAIKTKLDEIAHSKEYHDKDLDYVAFKNKQVLSDLVSPKKRGLETRGRTDAQGEELFDFDPNADYSKMSLKEREKWETEYKKMTAGGGLTTDAEGKKIFM